VKAAYMEADGKISIIRCGDWKPVPGRRQPI